MIEFEMQFFQKNDFLTRAHYIDAGFGHSDSFSIHFIFFKSRLFFQGRKIENVLMISFDSGLTMIKLRKW